MHCVIWPRLYLATRKHLSDAEALLRRATSLAPGYVAAWLLLGSLLHDSDRQQEAIACYLKSMELQPGNATAWSGLGAAYAYIGDMEKSADAYRRALEIQPDMPGVHMSHAHVLKGRGDQAASLRAYRKAIVLKPEFGEVYWSMANLKVFRFEPEEVAAMEQQLKRERPLRKRRSPFPVRPGEGLRGPGRLRPCLALLSERQSATATACVP